MDSENTTNAYEAIVAELRAGIASVYLPGHVLPRVQANDIESIPDDPSRASHESSWCERERCDQNDCCAFVRR